MKSRFGFVALALLAVPYTAFAQTSDKGATASSEGERFVPATIDNDGRAIVSGISAFGINLYRSVSSQSGDLAISPASISTAFGLAYAGAKGRTASEIAAVLHYPLDLPNFHASFGNLLTTMKLQANGRTMSVNNAIWLQQGLPVSDAYLALVERNYGAGLRRVDYVRDPEAARLAINGWVEDQTNKRIQNLLQPLDVTKDTRSILVNTVYFKADWASPFDKTQTKVEPFRRGVGKPVDLPLMNQRANFAYAEKDGVKALVLPYRGNETEMLILLPANPRGLAKLEASLGPVMLNAWRERLSKDTQNIVIVTLPKFRFEKRYELKGVLERLGMVVPFSNDSDFSGMKPSNVRKGDRFDWNLKISRVVHKVFVEVEEKGTEAAAATAFDIVLTSRNRNKPPPPRVFRADHPFVFLIRDRRTSVPLFIGRFMGQTAQ